jgi:hypothetical protein
MQMALSPGDNSVRMKLLRLSVKAAWGALMSAREPGNATP